MTLLKQVSDRVDNKGHNFVDFYLGWHHNSEVYLVRVRPQFYRDMTVLCANCVDVPKGEALEKYVE